MQDKKCFIKKLKKGLKVALTSTLISATLATGAATIYKSIDLNDYATTSQIESVVKDLDCNTSYLSKLNTRYMQMEHNGNEPIYVCFDKRFTQEEIESAKKSLSEIFGVVEKINKHYKYKIVSKEEYDSKVNRTKIYYTLGKTNVTSSGESAGHIERKNSLFSLLTQKRTYNDYKIYYNRSDSNSKLNMDYVFMHELFHAFGIEDTYTVKNNMMIHTNLTKSLIDNKYGASVLKLSPNDIKCLVALYQEKQSSKTKQDEYMHKMKTFVENYDKQYYNYFAKKCKEKTNSKFTFDESNVKTLSPISVTLDNGKQYFYNYNVDVQGDKYSFSITNEKDNVLDSCDGDVLWVDNVAILKDVDLNSGLRPGFEHFDYNYEQWVQDLVLVKTSEDKVSLYDISLNDLMFTKTIELQQVENDLNL